MAPLDLSPTHPSAENLQIKLPGGIISTIKCTKMIKEKEKEALYGVISGILEHGSLVDTDE